MPQTFALTAAQKALQINLDENIYGSFAEIGAGQETVRHFFRAGGASGTIAKAMSAYDKAFSDAIYGVETDGRYVTLSRLQKMLRHEYALMEARLNNEDLPNRKFFAYANTVATINFTKRFKGHGWMGIRFQSEAGGAPNDVWFHIRMREEEARLQQETIGDMGVNLIFGAFFKNQDVNELLISLFDNIHKDKMEIDMIHVDGPTFKDVDNRLLSLQLLKHGMTDAVIFGPDGTNILPASLLYKKNILALRGSFRPVTKVNLDMLQKGYEQFTAEKRVDKDRLVVLFEITLHNLKADGAINEQDFLDRAEVLCSLGHTVLISNYQEYYKLVEYFSRYTKSRMGLIMGLTNLKEIFNDKYYQGLSGGTLQAMGVLFSNDLKMYTYPSQPDPNGPVQQIKDLDIHPRLKPLLDYLLNNRRVVDIQDFDREVLQIFSPKVLGMIKDGKAGWEDFLPPYVDVIIKEKELFGYRSSTS
ncbi:MAG: TonB-dependent receptor [Flavobacteriia bacterium]|nr:TonB-dependent receptor [Flavobacteriia bacterium]